MKYILRGGLASVRNIRKMISSFKLAAKKFEQKQYWYFNNNLIHATEAH